jgi:hypothetical protein
VSKWILIALIGCVGGCASQLHKEMDLDTVTITWQRASLMEADRTCRALGVQAMPFPVEVIPACARWNGSHCTIIAPEPVNAGDTASFALLGHEVLHCFVGEFHPRR